MIAPTPRPYRIGIDVGGTNTDAVIIDTSVADKVQSVVAAHKAPTTKDITSGIESAVCAVLAQSKIARSQISSINIGTTHFINALVERDTRYIERVAVLRLSKSFTREVPPFSDFPPDLRRIIECYNAWVDGGLHIDGSPEAQVREDQVDEFCAEVRRRKLRVVAVVGVFSPLDSELQQERTVQRWIEQKCPGVVAVPSASISNIGLLERENATIINAAILNFARRTIAQFQHAIKGLGVSCPLYLTQNDGTLLDARTAAQTPIRTFNSGPTNSMRGAAYLCGITGDGVERSTSALVCDIGGTTSDIGMLLPSGYPRQTLLGSTVAGVRVNYAMPQVESIGVGGGSIVHQQHGQIKVGDESVGRRIHEEAIIFGGQTLTATDIAVATGHQTPGFGDASLLHSVDRDSIVGGNSYIKRSLERIVDALKTSPGDLELILVGGGSIIAPQALDGVSRVVRPKFFDVANAVGAATAKISVTVDTIKATTDQTTEQAIEATRLEALRRLADAGALEGTEQITEVDVLPLQYVNNQVRIYVKAVGDYDSLAPLGHAEDDVIRTTAKIHDLDFGAAPTKVHRSELHTNGEPALDELMAYKPKVEENTISGNLEWHISEQDLDWMADGCYVLGCGGGGDPRPEMLKLKSHLSGGHTLRCIRPESLRPDARVYWGGNMGSPSVPAERLCANETVEAMREIMDYHKHDAPDAIIGLEVGGSNGLLPFSLGSSKVFNAPVVDADWMGRAFPNLWQVSIVVHQPGSMLPVSIASGDGRRLLMTSAPNDKIVDETLRAPVMSMGYYVGLAASPCTGEAVSKWAIKNTMSQAWRIGRCIDLARHSNNLSTVCEQIIDEVGGPSAAKILFRGKIVDIKRRLHKGHSHGEVVIQHVEDDLTETRTNRQSSLSVVHGGFMRIPFMNENLMAIHTRSSETEEPENIVASVPDLVTVMSAGSGKALGIGDYRYGIHVVVLGICCAPVWRTEAGIRDGGPSAFGYNDVKYVPVGDYVAPRSVIDEYAPMA